MKVFRNLGRRAEDNEDPGVAEAIQKWKKMRKLHADLATAVGAASRPILESAERLQVLSEMLSNAQVGQSAGLASLLVSLSETEKATAQSISRFGGILEEKFVSPVQHAFDRSKESFEAEKQAYNAAKKELKLKTEKGADEHEIQELQEAVTEAARQLTNAVNYSAGAAGLTLMQALYTTFRAHRTQLQLALEAHDSELEFVLRAAGGEGLAEDLVSSGIVSRPTDVRHVDGAGTSCPLFSAKNIPLGGSGGQARVAAAAPKSALEQAYPTGAASGPPIRASAAMAAMSAGSSGPGQAPSAGGGGAAVAAPAAASAGPRDSVGAARPAPPGGNPPPLPSKGPPAKGLPAVPPPRPVPAAPTSAAPAPPLPGGLPPRPVGPPPGQLRSPPPIPGHSPPPQLPPAPSSASPPRPVAAAVASDGPAAQPQPAVEAAAGSTGGGAATPAAAAAAGETAAAASPAPAAAAAAPAAEEEDDGGLWTSSDEEEASSPSVRTAAAASVNRPAAAGGGGQDEHGPAAAAAGAGWEAFRDDNNGSIYFHHSELGLTQWERPAGFTGMPEGE